MSKLEFLDQHGDVMPLELRCRGGLHGKVLDGDRLEVKCKRKACGVRPGVVVLHTFDMKTGELVGTRRFADPKPRKE